MIIGKIPYLNCEPFFHFMNIPSNEFETNDISLPFQSNLENSFKIVQLPPRLLGQKAEEGIVDTGPMSLVDYLRLRESFELLGNFCIAAKSKARSVLLFSRASWENLGGAIIGISEETSTSVRLLKVLFAQKYKVKPAEYRLGVEKGCDAILLIGDKALKVGKSGLGDLPLILDLGEEWWEWKGSPFVFAVWVVRKSLDSGAKRSLLELLEYSVREGEKNLRRIAEDCKENLGMTEEEIVEYLEGFNYRLGAEEMWTMEEFEKLLKNTFLDLETSSG